MDARTFSDPWDRWALSMARAYGYRPQRRGRGLAPAIRRLRRLAARPLVYDHQRIEPYAAEHQAQAVRLAQRLTTIQRSDFNHEDNTMRISAAFPSNYLKAQDLQGRVVTVTIGDCQLAHFDEGDKPALSFSGKDRGLVLNKTNAAIIADAYGDETDHWRGRPLELYADRVMFSGRMVDAIRVRVPAPPAAATPEAQPAAVPYDNDIPF